jgi:hypothetical protein
MVLWSRRASEDDMRTALVTLSVITAAMILACGGPGPPPTNLRKAPDDVQAKRKAVLDDLVRRSTVRDWKDDSIRVTRAYRQLDQDDKIKLAILYWRYFNRLPDDATEDEKRYAHAIHVRDVSTDEQLAYMTTNGQWFSDE